MTSTSTVSPKFQVVIPQAVRAGIQPGTKVAWVPYQGNLHVVPLRPIEELCGICKGMDTTFEREPDRKL